MARLVGRLGRDDGKARARNAGGERLRMRQRMGEVDAVADDERRHADGGEVAAGDARPVRGDIAEQLRRQRGIGTIEKAEQRDEICRGLTGEQPSRRGGLEGRLASLGDMRARSAATSA